MEKLGQVQLNDRKILVEEVVRMLPYTTVTLLGPSGTGKTTFAEEIAKDERLGIDKLVILRLQGLCSEDFRIPTLQEEIDIATGEKTNKKIVEFAKIGIFKEIVDNPQTKYLLFLDEILRADANVAPLLFELLERKITFEDLKKEVLKHKDRKVMVEFIKKQDARDFYNLLKDEDLTLYEISGDDNNYERKKILNKKKND